MNQPLVTIVTSTYKHEKYISQTIDSVLNQDYPNIEYIVINDGSPDSTEEILKSYGNKFYWETQPNMGETPTLNKAFRMAKGTYVAKLSSDDVLYPGAVRAMVDCFLAQPEIVIVYSDFDLIDEDGVKYGTVRKPEFDFVDPIRKHLCLPGPGALFKKEIFESLGGLDPNFRIVADLDFWWRASLIGPFAHISKPLSAFRQHRNSQTTSGGSKMCEETMRCVQKFYSLPNIPDNLRKVKNEAFSNGYYSAAMQHILASGDLRKPKTILWKSFFYSPRNYFKEENRAKMVEFLNVAVSPKIVPVLKKCFIKAHGTR